MKSAITFAISFSVILVFLSCNKKPRMDCSNYKEGKFYVIDKISRITTEVTRTKELQIEKDMLDGTLDTIRIEWLSDCTYALQYTQKPQPGKLTVEIIKIVQDTIYVRGSFPGIEYQPVLRMIKIMD